MKPYFPILAALAAMLSSAFLCLSSGKLPAPAWSYTGSQLDPGLLAADGKVLLVDGGELVALDAASGALAWRTALPGIPRGSEYANWAELAGVQDGRLVLTLYAEAAGDSLVAIELSSGELLWQVDGLSKPLLAGGRVIVRQGKDLLALELADGRESGRIAAPALLARDEQGLLYGYVDAAGEQPAQLFAWDGQGTALRWTTTPSATRADNALKAGGGRLYFIAGADNQAYLAALDTATGQQLWRTAVPAAAPIPGAYIILPHSESVYVYCYDGQVPQMVRIAAADGQAGAPFAFRGPLSFVDGGVVYSIDGVSQRAYDLQAGKELWNNSGGLGLATAARTVRAGQALYVLARREATMYLDVFAHYRIVVIDTRRGQVTARSNEQNWVVVALDSDGERVFLQDTNVVRMIQASP